MVFVSRLWQIHIFGEGNTRTTAVFFIKYVRTLGFEATNDIFAENAWYFRNALVRANYNNLLKGIHETTEYLELFLRNLFCNDSNELHNRALHISGMYKEYQKADIGERKPDIGGGKADIGDEKADIDIATAYENAFIGLSAKTMGHIRQMYHAFGRETVFGRADIQSVTGLGASRASELLKTLLEKEIIQAVKGHGKGKYRFLIASASLPRK